MSVQAIKMYPILRQTRRVSDRVSLRALRNYSTEPPHLEHQPPTPPRPNPHRQFYKSGGLGRAIGFNFLIALCTFQVLYWSWLKLESIETKQEKEKEIKALEGELQSLTEKAEVKVKEKAEDVKEKAKSWFSWR